MPLLAVGVTNDRGYRDKSRNPVSLVASYSCPTLRRILPVSPGQRAPAGCIRGKTSRGTEAGSG